MGLECSAGSEQLLHLLGQLMEAVFVGDCDGNSNRFVQHQTSRPIEGTHLFVTLAGILKAEQQGGESDSVSRIVE